MVFRLGGPGPPWALLLGGQTYVLAPFTNKRPDYWGGHGPPGPPYNYLTDLKQNKEPFCKA